MKNRFLAFALCCTLGMGTMTTTGCSSAQFVSEFNQYSSQIVPAVNSILAILQLFGVVGSAAAPSLISADVVAAQKLVSDLASAPAAAQPGIRNQITAEEGVLTNDLQSIFQLARVSDDATQKKVALLISLIQAAVAEGFALIPQSTSPTAMAVASSRAQHFQSRDFEGSFNSILKAKTGNAAVDKLSPKLQLHHHSRVLRIASLGLLK